MQLFVSLTNNGAATSTGINAVLSTTTPGVTVTQNTSAYPNIAAGAFSAQHHCVRHLPRLHLVCGTIMQFKLAVTTARATTLFPSRSRPASRSRRRAVFFDDFENGVNGWTTGGTNNTWAQTTAQSYSPTHSWTDSPAGNYWTTRQLLAAARRSSTSPARPA